MSPQRVCPAVYPKERFIPYQLKVLSADLRWWNTGLILSSEILIVRSVPYFLPMEFLRRRASGIVSVSRMALLQMRINIYENPNRAWKPTFITMFIDRAMRERLRESHSTPLTAWRMDTTVLTPSTQECIGIVGCGEYVGMFVGTHVGICMGWLQSVLHHVAPELLICAMYCMKHIEIQELTYQLIF